MIAPKGKPVTCEDLTWRDVDELIKKMKMAIISTAACEQPSGYLPLAVDSIDCSGVAKRISKRIGVPKTIDKIVDPITTILVKFLIIIVFVQKSWGGKKTIWPL